MAVNTAEAEFRRVERLLDDLVKAAEHQLSAPEVLLEDRSARTYHYKNQHLCWWRSFLKEWRVEAERARVTVDLMYMEPMQLGVTPELEISWRAELYQQGHESRVDKRGRSRCALSTVQQRGIGQIILGAMGEGSDYLPQAL